MTIGRYALAIISSAAIFAAVTASSRAHAAACMPLFPYQDRWAGGDGAISIPLISEGPGTQAQPKDTECKGHPCRDLWLFGDTFIARPGRTTRRGSTMVANTIAISSCRGGQWSIQYHWRQPHRGHKPRAFFDSGTDAFKYWPMDGFVDQHTLYVALLRVVNAAQAPFGFKLTGVDLAMIPLADAEMDPGKWSITYRTLSRSDKVFPGISIVLQPPYVMMYATMERETDHHTAVILTRLRLDRLAHPGDALEYLATTDKKWQPAPVAGDATELVAEGQSSFSVSYRPEIAEWVMVQQAPNTLSGPIGIRTAPNPEGPWSPFHSIAGDAPLHYGRKDRKDVWCYGAREHPSLDSTPGTLVVTYVCTSWSFRTLVQDMSLYHPITIQLPMR